MAPRTLPRLERYLASLPGGLDAHPECLAKGALVRVLLEGGVPPAAVRALPEPLRILATEPPVGSEWIPEVWWCALLVGLTDALELGDDEALAWTRARARALYQSPAYRILMAVARPAQLLRHAGARWSNFHRGTALEVDGIADDGVRASLVHPPGLFDATVLRHLAQALAAALELANAAGAEVAVVSASRIRCRFKASWN